MEGKKLGLILKDFGLAKGKKRSRFLAGGFGWWLLVVVLVKITTTRTEN
jgi:hypothetical protein